MRGRKGTKLRHKGAARTINEWAREVGLNPWTLRKRLARGWKRGRALTWPKRTYRRDDDPAFGFR